MGFFYFGLFLLYVMCSISVIIPVRKFAKNKWLPLLTVLFFILFPTYDILIQKVAMTYYGKTQTLQEVDSSCKCTTRVFEGSFSPATKREPKTPKVTLLSCYQSFFWQSWAMAEMATSRQKVFIKAGGKI